MSAQDVLGMSGLTLIGLSCLLGWGNGEGTTELVLGVLFLTFAVLGVVLAVRP